MNSGKTRGSSGFVARISILLVLLACVGGAFAYDRLVLIPAGSEAVDRIAAACVDPAASKESIQKIAGRDASSMESLGVYEMESYRFGRILPNLQGWSIDVVYKDGIVVESFKGGITDANKRLYKNQNETNATDRSP